jgi:hypothetical protein
VERTIRRNTNLVLTVFGIGVVFGSVLLARSWPVQLQMLPVIIGVLLMEAGVWGLASKLLPNQRVYSGLRMEGDHILSLIRKLNGVAVAKELGIDNNRQFERTLEEMHMSVTRMADLAGKPDVEASILVAEPVKVLIN